jgi:flagellar hook-associated protein 3 FlgL
MRITNQAQQATALSNLFRITEDLFRANERVATGLRVNNPSDDPSAFRDSLTLKTSISQRERFGRTIDANKVFVEAADSALNSVGLGLIRARELGLQSLSGTDTAETRNFAATELGNIIDQALQAANSRVKNQFLFSGTRVRTQPYNKTGAGIEYLGNQKRFTVEIADNQQVPVLFPGSEVFAADLNPRLTTSTLLSDLNGGAGIPAGSFTLTDRAGNSANIAVAAGGTINNILTTINGSGLNVTAALNSAGDGLVLTDTSTTIIGALTVAENGGTTAASLGILGEGDGTIQGQDLNPRLTGTTLISDLNGGQGLTLGSIDIVNGAASGPVTLSGATTINDVITAINGSAANVTASINGIGNGLRVDSNNPSTVAVVREVAGGNTASILGLGGAGNVFVALEKLQQALQTDDTYSIVASLDALETTLTNLNDSRAEMGAVSRRMTSAQAVHEDDVVKQTDQLSELTDTDVVKEASNVAQLQFALNASLNTTARILQPSLLDFLR